MAIKVINVGSKANGGGGDALRDAMIKINENFTELYDRTGGDVASSIIGADSTVLVDGPNSSLNADALTGTAPAGVVTFPNISNTPTTVAGYGITDAYTKAQTNQQIAIETNEIKSDLASGGAGAIDASVLTGSLPAIDGSALTGITAGVASSLDGDMTGSVFADDSTLLVDGVSGTIPAANLTGALPAIDGSALTGVASAFSDLTGTPTTLSGYGITDAYTQTQVDTAITNATSSIVIPSGSSQSIDVVAADSTLLVDSSNGTLNSSALTKPIELADTEEVRFGTDNDMRIMHSGISGLIQNSTGTLVIAGPIVRIQDAGSSQSAFSASNGIATLYHLNTEVLNTTAGGIQIEKGVREKFATTNGATGVTALDCSTGHVHYLTAPAGDITANFTNLDLTAEYATNVTVVIDQGGTEYEITAVQIGGVAQTIVWQGNSAPTGTANGVDSFSFTILNDGGTYVVLGQMVAFGGV